MQRGHDGSRQRLRRIDMLVLVMLAVISVSGCAPRAIPPSADIAAGVYENVAFEFMHWDEGLAIMIWHNVLGDSGSVSNSNSSGYELAGYAEAQDGERFEWDVQTDDGKTAKFQLAGRSYALSDGQLFIVTMEDGTADVTQLQRDLSDVQPNASSCIAFAKDEPLLAEFIRAHNEAPRPPSSKTDPPPDAWATYTNRAHGFALRHPPEWETPPNDVSESRGTLGKNIVFSVSADSPYWMGCLLEGLGDCPVMEQVKFARTGDPPRTAISIQGYIGAIGGRIPQQYLTYVLRDHGTYYVFTLYAVGLDAATGDASTIAPLNATDVTTFEQMLGTLTFQIGPGG